MGRSSECGADGVGFGGWQRAVTVTAVKEKLLELYPSLTSSLASALGSPNEGSRRRFGKTTE